MTQSGEFANLVMKNIIRTEVFCTDIFHQFALYCVSRKFRTCRLFAKSFTGTDDSTCINSSSNMWRFI